jgi:hypothetical protein
VHRLKRKSERISEGCYGTSELRYWFEKDFVQTKSKGSLVTRGCIEMNSRVYKRRHTLFLK